MDWEDVKRIVKKAGRLDNTCNKGTPNETITIRFSNGMDGGRLLFRYDGPEHWKRTLSEMNIEH